MAGGGWRQLANGRGRYRQLSNGRERVDTVGQWQGEGGDSWPLAGGGWRESGSPSRPCSHLDPLTRHSQGHGKHHGLLKALVLHSAGDVSAVHLAGRC